MPTALVTGGGSGIGAATCRALAGRGFDVVIADVDAEGGETVAADLESSPGESLFVETDVSDEAAQ